MKKQMDTEPSVDQFMAAPDCLSESTLYFEICLDHMKPLQRITFIVGGARSGKSRFALTLGEEVSGRKMFVATAEALDAEMADRIRRHRRARSKTWETIEEPVKLCNVLGAKSKPYQLILIDCLTLWLSNLMQKDNNPKAVFTEIDRLVDCLKRTELNVILVSNEVGWGIIPENPLARGFRDLAGLMNQKIAEAAEAVYLMSTGIPVRIK
jgi:adenosylcobinamide kinase/adenosylcobinamide-phosphate guanylyltransferase